MTFKEFKKEINKQRKAKIGWYTFVGYVERKLVKMKAYGTWLQVYDVDGIHYGNCSDQSVAKFNQDLGCPFKEENENAY